MPRGSLGAGFMKGKVSSGVFCSVCRSEMVYINHARGCLELVLVCTHGELHGKINGGSVTQLVSHEHFRSRFWNVLELYLGGGLVVPFKVRRVSWADGAYFVILEVVQVVGSGGVHFEFYGFFVNRQRSDEGGVESSRLNRAECCEWVRVE